MSLDASRTLVAYRKIPPKKRGRKFQKSATGLLFIAAAVFMEYRGFNRWASSAMFVVGGHIVAGDYLRLAFLFLQDVGEWLVGLLAKIRGAR